MRRIYISILLFGTLFVCAPSITRAASLSFSAPETTSVGTIFSLRVLVDSADRGFNAAEGTVAFPKDILEVVSIDTAPASTVFNFWTSLPSFSNDQGLVFFSGGSTRGIVGSGMQIVTIHFRAKGSGDALITASDASVNASDGSGTNILDNIIAKRIRVNPASVTTPAETEPSEPEPVPIIVTPGKVPTDDDICLRLFTHCDLPFPTIKTVSVGPRTQLGVEIFASGVASAGSHVHLRLTRNGTYYKEIIAIIQPDRTWQGTFKDIVAYGHYAIDATAEDVNNHGSEPTTWSDIDVFPPYTLHFLDFAVRWYTLTGIALIMFVVALGILLARRYKVFRDVRREVLYLLAAVGIIAAVSLGGYIFWMQEYGAPSGFWKNTAIPCINQKSSFMDTYDSIQLEIYVDGTLQTIPTNIGISPKCVAKIHTHDDTGHLHYEQTEKGVTLLDFFTVVGEPLRRPGYGLVVTVNGENYTDTIDSYVLHDGDVIVINYTTQKSVKSSGSSNDPVAPSTHFLFSSQ